MVIYYYMLTIHLLPVHYLCTTCALPADFVFYYLFTSVGYCLVSTWRIHVHYMFTTCVTVCLLRVLLLVHYMCITHVSLHVYYFEIIL